MTKVGWYKLKFVKKAIYQTRSNILLKNVQNIKHNIFSIKQYAEDNVKETKNIINLLKSIYTYI